MSRCMHARSMIVRMREWHAYARVGVRVASVRKQQVRRNAFERSFFSFPSFSFFFFFF